MGRPTGRPTKLTPAVQTKIVDAIAAGNYAEVAAAYAGIGDTTFYKWMARGEQESSGIYREFRDAVKLAEARDEVYAVTVIRQSFGENWQAAMTHLERRYPARWGRKDVLRIERDKILEETRQLAREAGADEDAAVAEVKRMLGVR